MIAPTTHHHHNHTRSKTTRTRTSSSKQIPIISLLLFLLLLVLLHQTVFVVIVVNSFSFENTVKNFRPAVKISNDAKNVLLEEAAQQQPFFFFYRSASLDDLSESDARALLDGSAFCFSNNDLKEGTVVVEADKSSSTNKLAAVIDLRNIDEIQKGQSKRTAGSHLFYSSLISTTTTTTITSLPLSYSPSNAQQPLLYHAPLLSNINSFWDEAINRMDGPTRFKATFQTIYSGGALDRAAARFLEEKGLSELYTIMLCSGAEEIGRVLKVCKNVILCAAADDDGLDGGDEGSDAERVDPVILFQCQKGKDRTGVLSMLLQYACHPNISDEEIINSYSLSGDLLGGLDASSSSSFSTKSDTKQSSSSSTMLDWSRFRGSPKSAMKRTLQWIRNNYGSVKGYMDFIAFDEREREELRDGIRRLSERRMLVSKCKVDV